jgi:hypothetical protein
MAPNAYSPPFALKLREAPCATISPSPWKGPVSRSSAMTALMCSKRSGPCAER